MVVHGRGGGRSSSLPVAAINLHPPALRRSRVPPSLASHLPAFVPFRSCAYLARLSSLLLRPLLPSAFCSVRYSCLCTLKLVFGAMEGKKQPVSSSSPKRTTSSSLVADLFGGKNAPGPSSSSFFHSVFPPAATVMGRDSSRSDIFSPSWKNEGQSQTWNAQNVAADGMPQGSGNKERNSAYQHEKIDPCTFSSSLYYGGQDICTNMPSSHNPGYDYKKDGEDDSNNPNAASRGNWWQGGLYY